jgi:hypothetical protein
LKHKSLFFSKRNFKAQPDWGSGVDRLQNAVRTQPERNQNATIVDIGSDTQNESKNGLKSQLETQFQNAISKRSLKHLLQMTKRLHIRNLKTQLPRPNPLMLYQSQKATWDQDI